MTVPPPAQAWPWLGALAAFALVCLLFGTRRLCGPVTGSRWRDPAWLAWLAVGVYLIHNVEEYGVDALGRAYAFPPVLGRLVAGAGDALPNAFFIAVNLSLVWVAFPAAALGAKRRPCLALAGPGVMAVNLVTHVASAFRVGYNPGLVTALLVFLPLAVWTASALVRGGQVAVRDLARAVGAGIVLHAVLMASVLAYVHGDLGAVALVAIQVVNPVVMITILWWNFVPARRACGRAG